MFDIGWTELLLIGIVALIVIGPQDLPDMFRQLGRFTAKLRSMSRDFQRAIEQAAKETGVKDLAKDVNNIASPSSLGLNAMKDAADRFEKWDPLKPAKPKQPLTPPPMPPKPAAAPASTAPTPEELADSEPEPQVGPETKALYEKRAKAAEARKSAQAAKADAKSVAQPADATPRAAPKAKRKPAAPAVATADASAPTPKAPRRKKADPA